LRTLAQTLASVGRCCTNGCPRRLSRGDPIRSRVRLGYSSRHLPESEEMPRLCDAKTRLWLPLRVVAALSTDSRLTLGSGDQRASPLGCPRRLLGVDMQASRSAAARRSQRTTRRRPTRRPDRACFLCRYGRPSPAGRRARRSSQAGVAGPVGDTSASTGKRELDPETRACARLICGRSGRVGDTVENIGPVSFLAVRVPRYASADAAGA
jgi:hypothetical protein